MNTQSTRPVFGFSLGALVSFLLLSACATTPETNQMLIQARQQVNQAQQTPAVTQHAALTLQEAESSLEKAESVWEEEGRENVEEVEQYAYLARQQANTAMQRAALGEAQEEIEQASAMREQVLRQAREKELQAAQRRAEQAERQAQAAQQPQQPRAQPERQQLEELQAAVEELQMQQTERGMVTTLDDVLFDFGEAELKPGGERVVEQLAVYMEANPDRKLLVEGFTDSVGDEEFNRDLSRRRADAVRDQLLTEGISAERIVIEGHGEDYPIATNETLTGRQLNRRVEVVIGPTGGETPQPRG
jgi:outer membrane protein OmpA-like peptidoglycan-associated protein